MTTQGPLQDTHAVYLAPMRFCDEPRRIPDEYTVYLKLDHTLEQHKRRVNMGALSAAIFGGNGESAGDEIWYLARLDADLLAGVRGDSGVKLVECNTWVQVEFEVRGGKAVGSIWGSGGG